MNETDRDKEASGRGGGRGGWQVGEFLVHRKKWVIKWEKYILQIPT